jgi:hypothetical protein
LEVLSALVQAKRAALPDDATRSLFTEQLVRDVFAEAWKAQFEDNRAQFRREVKRIVDELIAEQRLNREAEP